MRRHDAYDDPVRPSEVSPAGKALSFLDVEVPIIIFGIPRGNNRKVCASTVFVRKGLLVEGRLGQSTTVPGMV